MRVNNEKQIGFSFLISLYIALKPVYFFDSGMLQISDFVLIFSIGFYLLKQRYSITNCISKQYGTFLTLLLMYQILINVLWYIGFPDNRLLVSCMFYIYNFIAFFYFISVGSNFGVDYLRKSIVIGILLSSFITMLGILTVSSTAERQTGFFNNPNQLGLHGLLIITLLLLTSKNNTKMINSIVGFISIYSILLSASKAAFISCAVLIALCTLFISGDKKIWRKMIVVIILVFIAYIFLFSELSFLHQDSKILYMRRRLELMSAESDSNLATGRGYARIKEMGIHLLWGMGEGAYSRFEIMENHEVHSLIANLIVSYGLIGAIGYAILWGGLVKNKSKTFKNTIILSGIILYSISHNSVRNTLLWLIFSLLFLEKNTTIVKNEVLDG